MLTRAQEQRYDRRAPRWQREFAAAAEAEAAAKCDIPVRKARPGELSTSVNRTLTIFDVKSPAEKLVNDPKEINRRQKRRKVRTH
jgi:hypothetical protein